MADNFQYVQGQEYQLSGSGITLSATSITLKSFQLPDNATNIAMTDFGTIGYGVLAPGTSKEESISFTGVTQNGDGTATLTGVTRGLKFVADYTQDTALRNAHAGGAVFIVTNSAAFYDGFVGKDNDETITGTHTFTNPNLPKVDTYSAPTTDEQFTTKKYVDDLALGGTTTVDRLVSEATAGETVAAGKILYFDEAQDEWMLADASITGTSENLLLAISQGAGTDGNLISGGALLYGMDSNQSGFTKGDSIYISDTPGSLTSTPGTKTVQVGYAHSATEVFFAPTNFKTNPTQDEKDALAGTSGTPSTSNKYVTDDDADKTTTVDAYAADAGSTDTYVITLSPAPSAYTAGMTVKFKANTINTGAATLNVNSLGAKAITKNGTTVLEDGDILANQVVTLIYDGTQFQLQTPQATTPANNYAVGIDSRAGDAASGTQTIAHGLGRVPIIVRITVTKETTGSSASFGTFDGTNNAVVAHIGGDAGYGGAASSSTYGVFISDSDAYVANNSQRAVISVDATNITLTWTKTTNPSSNTMYIMWEAR